MADGLFDTEIAAALDRAARKLAHDEWRAANADAADGGSLTEALTEAIRELFPDDDAQRLVVLVLARGVALGDPPHEKASEAEESFEEALALIRRAVTVVEAAGE